MATLNAKDQGTQVMGWAERHNRAVNRVIVTQTHESAVAYMAKAWGAYATAHNKRFGSPIGCDYVLGPAWEQIGKGLRDLLNGETGALDCGTVDAFILGTMTENGVDTSKF